MVGNLDSLMRQVLSFSVEVMDRMHQFPYVAFVVKDTAVVSRAVNEVYQNLDPTAHCDAVAIRRAQMALETGDLSECTLISLFEPTVLSFDVALWASIHQFVWCLDKEDLPDQYTSIPYGPREYLRDHPRKISVSRGVLREQGLKIMHSAIDQKLSLVAAPYSRQIELFE